MSFQTGYEISEELQLLMLQANALDVLRNAYARLRLFGYRPAIMSAMEAEKCRREFWRRVIAAYPHLAGKRLSYCEVDGRIREVRSRSTDSPRRPDCDCGKQTPAQQIFDGRGNRRVYGDQVKMATEERIEKDFIKDYRPRM